jgi:hypothetical protein
MDSIWDEFVDDLDTHLVRINIAIADAFTAVLNITSTTNLRSALRTFASVLRHRRQLALSAVDHVVEILESDLDSLRSDTVSPVQTAYIGQLMESTYHAANMEFGKSRFYPLLCAILIPSVARFRE